MLVCGIQLGTEPTTKTNQAAAARRPACKEACTVVWHVAARDRLCGFLPFAFGPTATRFFHTGCGAAGSAGPADQDSAPINESQVAAAFASRRGVHARHDHASCAGGRDDCADPFAYGE